MQSKPHPLKRLVRESVRSSGPRQSNRIRHLSGLHAPLVSGCPFERSSYPSRCIGGSTPAAGGKCTTPRSVHFVLSKGAGLESEFCSGTAIGADVSFLRSPGGAMKHTGTTGLSRGGVVVTVTGPTLVRPSSHLRPFLSLFFFASAGLQIVAG